MKTYLETMNATTGDSAVAKVADSLPDAYAGDSGNTVRTLIRNVPDAITPKQITKMLEASSVAAMRKRELSDLRHVWQWAELVAYVASDSLAQSTL